jgi:hypothetical protein
MHAKIAEQQMILAYAHSRAHRDLSEQALLVYGDHGSPISGVVRDHFPEFVKNELRSLSLRVARLLDESRVSWSKARKHLRTWIRLKDAIIAKYGKGYYG